MITPAPATSGGPFLAEGETPPGATLGNFVRVPRRHYGRWLSAALLLLALAGIVSAFANGQIAWGIVAQFMFAPAILEGLVNTILMTFCAMALGIALGIMFAVLVMSPNPVLRASAVFYIWFFRGTPLLLQLLIWFNLALVFPTIGIPGLFQMRTVDAITPFIATLLGLGLNQGAYTAEVVRGGIMSVDGWPDGGGKDDRHDKAHDIAAHRAAAGDARHHPACRQRDGQHGEAHLGGERHPVFGDPALGADRLLCQRTRDRVAARCRRLVSAGRYCFEYRAGVLGAPVFKRLALTARTQTAGPAPLQQSVQSPVQPQKPRDIVVARNVTKSFGGFKALKGITLSVAEREVLCIIGPSGSGKSTFLRCINQLESVDDGGIWVDGELVGHRQVGNALYELSDKEIARQRLVCGMVFQRFNLFGHMTAVENVIEGPVTVLRRDRAESVREAEQLLAKVGLSKKFNSYPRQLSGGEQQRVAIARALAMHPKILLFDEPTSALDPELVGDVLNVMRDLAKSGMTMIIVTHEIGFAREVADRVLFMESGALVEIGTAQEVLGAPKQSRTREFLAAVLS